MKCCRPKFLFLYIFLFAASAAAKVYKLVPVDKKEISTGDRAQVRVVPESIDGRIPALTGKRIAGVFYVMEQKDDLLETIIAPPEQPGAGKAGAPMTGSEDKFIPEGFDYSFKKTETIQDFLVEDVDYSLGNPWIKWIILTLFLVSLGLARPALLTAKERRRKRELRRKEKAELEKIMEDVSKARNRKEIESLYGHKEKIRDSFEYDKKAYEAFFSVLFEIQYKPEWTASDESEVRESLANMKKGLKLKSGI